MGRAVQVDATKEQGLPFEAIRGNAPSDGRSLDADLSPGNLAGVLERLDGKFRPAWQELSPPEQVALARYFLPHKSSKKVLGPTRPRVVKWYCPFACQSQFPSGHRYCINVYSGCEHQCEYCYATSYEPVQAGEKRNFRRMILQDMADLERFDVPPAPVHMSNSTDPFQPLETRTGHARFALEQVLAHRRRFTTVTVLTKNPLLAAGPGYVDVLKRLVELPAGHPKAEGFRQHGWPGVCVEVSLAFWRDEARAAYEPQAPSIQARIAGLRQLRDAGIPIVLRIDPLFPQSPLAETPPCTLADFGLVEAQTLDDLDRLAALAKELAVRHVVYSAAKIVQPRARRMSAIMASMRQAYERAARPQRLVFRSGSWRLPQDVAMAKVVGPFLEACRRHDIRAKFCMQNVLETP